MRTFEMVVRHTCYDSNHTGLDHRPDNEVRYDVRALLEGLFRGIVLEARVFYDNRLSCRWFDTELVTLQDLPGLQVRANTIVVSWSRPGFTPRADVCTRCGWRIGLAFDAPGFATLCTGTGPCYEEAVRRYRAAHEPKCVFNGFKGVCKQAVVEGGILCPVHQALTCEYCAEPATHECTRAESFKCGKLSCAAHACLAHGG